MTRSILPTDRTKHKNHRGIPQPALRRLPVYYRRMLQAIEEGVPFVSSDELGKSAGVPGAQVRKDISCLSQHGRSGVGYDARSMASHLEELLGLVNDKEAVLVGVGNLGRALALYPGFSRYKLQIIALFDNNPSIVGQTVGDQQILPVEKLINLAQRLHIQVGIITVPAEAAQEVANTMIAGGIKVIWNFAPCRLTVPGDILVKNEDLATELAALSHRIAKHKVVVFNKAEREDVRPK
ncbi:MAG: Redox-sensing transcriptional repressor Rex [candidate division WS2 bacterium]|nr:Redox-sensing transcriptional repressor Rex [Candidatus Psychracetigena formicireducens]